MEAAGCTEPPEENLGPDAFYVEEAQATLAHIQELGLSELSERILSLEPHPQIVRPLSRNNKRKNDLLTFSRSSLNSGKVNIFYLFIFIVQLPHLKEKNC